MKTESILKAAVMMVLPIVLFGCASAKSYSKFDAGEALNGKKVVVYFQSHERLQEMSDGIEKRITRTFQSRSIEALPYKQAGLSLSDNALADFAKEKGADYIFAYALTSASIYNMALSGVTSEGSIIRVGDGKALWKGSVDYSNHMPGPGSWGTGEAKIGEELVAKLTVDGFLK